METDLQELLRKLYSHTMMTLDDILYIAKSNGIAIDTSIEDRLTARKDSKEITFDMTSYANGTIFIFDIE